jgi:hypothetical protein
MNIITQMARLDCQFHASGSIIIRVNVDIGHYFQTIKGVRHGGVPSDSFNIITDMLAITTARAKEDGQVQGLITRLVEGGVSILQYADDTIFFMERDLERKWLT